MCGTYWNHNTAYHPWILKQIHGNDRVLDVGCGDGLLVQRVSAVCGQVTGIEPHMPSAGTARERLRSIENAAIEAVAFAAYPAEPRSFDVVIFAASLHHMDLESAVKRAVELLAPGGRLLVAGCAKPDGPADWCVECLRIITARIGSLLRGERDGGDTGAPVRSPRLSLRQIRNVAKQYLPHAKIRRGLYYHYLLSWIK